MPPSLWSTTSRDERYFDAWLFLLLSLSHDRSFGACLFTVNKEEKKNIRDCKQMKDKTRLKLTVYSSMVGKKCPLSAVGKLKVPERFYLKEPPFPYTHQKNTRSDRYVFKRRINRVFRPMA